MAEFKKSCPICSGQFVTSTHNKIVCSRRCKLKYRVIWNRAHVSHRKPKIEKACIICGKNFLIARNDRICCSKECARQRTNYRARTIYSKMDKVMAYRREWQKNKHRKEWRAKWQKKNSKRMNEKARQRRKMDLAYRLRVILRSTISRYIRKKHTYSYYTNYTVKELIDNITSKFKPGMSWDGHSLRGWHIDHIRPLSDFNFYNPDGTENINEIRKAMALDNLQPLNSIDNISKGAKIISKGKELY